MRRDLYADVSARIIAELERGAAPWVKPWSVTPGRNTPQNAVSNRPYSGCNVILLWLAHDRGWATPRFLTFKQALEAGGHVRKGEHGTKVYFVKQLQVKDGDGKEAEKRCARRRPCLLRDGLRGPHTERLRSTRKGKPQCWKEARVNARGRKATIAIAFS